MPYSNHKTLDSSGHNEYFRLLEGVQRHTVKFGKKQLYKYVFLLGAGMNYAHLTVNHSMGF